MLIWRCWRSRVGFMARIPPSCVRLDRDVVQTTSFSPQRHGGCGVLLATKPTNSRAKWTRASGLQICPMLPLSARRSADFLLSVRCCSTQESRKASNLKKLFEDALDSAKLVQVLKTLETEGKLPAFSEAAMQVLIEQEITGPDLLCMTKEELIAFGVKGGPATRIMNLVEEANGPTVVPTAPPGKQVAGAVSESGLRQVLRGSCPMGVECACAQTRDTYRTEKLNWCNQKIVREILTKGTDPVFLEREAQMEELVKRLRDRLKDGKWSSDKQSNPLLVVPNSPGTGKSLFLAMLGQALEAGALEGSSVREVWPTMTSENDVLTKTVVSAFTYNSEMTFPLNIENPGAALFSRALYGALGAKCTQFQAVRFSTFAKAVRAQNTWGAIDDIMREFKELTAGTENDNTAFVLLVDELAQITEDSSPFARSTLTALGAWLQASRNHLAVVTALHEAFVRAGVTGSNRKVKIATILTDLSCVNGNAEALVPVFREALDVDESRLTPSVRLQLQRTIALSGGHPRSLRGLYDALLPAVSETRLRQEILKGCRADWKEVVQRGIHFFARDTAHDLLLVLANDRQRAELSSALSRVLQCAEVQTYQFKELVEKGILHLAGQVTNPEDPKARVDTKPALLLLLLHAARKPGCSLDPCVRQLAGLLFEDAGDLTGIVLDSDGLPTTVDPGPCISAFSEGRLSESAERVVCWGVGRMLVAEHHDLRSKLLGPGSQPAGASVSIVVPPEKGNLNDRNVAFDQRLSALNVGEMEIHMAPRGYPAADCYLVKRTNVEVAGQIKLFWNGGEAAIADIRRSAQKVKTGNGALQVSRFVLLICSDIVSDADIEKLKAAESEDGKEAPVDEVFVAADLAKVVPRSLMRVTWMGVPPDSEDDAGGTDESKDGGTP